MDVPKGFAEAGHLFDRVYPAPLFSLLMVFRPPGPLRRWLAYSYCSLTQREVEFLALSRDTSESDIKQRREITDREIRYFNHVAFCLTEIRYIDQSAVSAAIEGRVLILEGLEKCERNVLPIINNLLENR